MSVLAIVCPSVLTTECVRHRCNNGVPRAGCRCRLRVGRCTEACSSRCTERDSVRSVCAVVHCTECTPWYTVCRCLLRVYSRCTAGLCRCTEGIQQVGTQVVGRAVGQPPSEPVAEGPKTGRTCSDTVAKGHGELHVARLSQPETRRRIPKNKYVQTVYGVTAVGRCTTVYGRCTVSVVHGVRQCTAGRRPVRSRHVPAPCWTAWSVLLLILSF